MIGNLQIIERLIYKYKKHNRIATGQGKQINKAVNESLTIPKKDKKPIVKTKLENVIPINLVNIVQINVLPFAGGTQ